jgi:pimeloyl-ACP methyl ester carboxylesterase
MVLLHGFTNCWRAWMPVLEPLEAQHSILALTAGGHAGGPSFSDGSRPGLASMADIIERQMDEEGIERAHLVGNSMGGWLALALALRGRAISVVALCPAAGWERGSPVQAGVCRLFRRNELMLGIVRPWLETIARRPGMRAIAFREVIAFPRRLGPALALAQLQAAAGCRVPAGLVPEMLDTAVALEVDGIECPVRIGVGSKDRLFPSPEHHARLRRLLPEADWIELEGVGHIPMSDDPDQVSEAILGFTASI